MPKFSPQQLQEFTDKASKDPAQLALYESTDNYIESYSKHTDWRIQHDGPAMAIGGQWEEHGLLQLQFLIEKGLARASRLLDLGCGTGRFARHAVAYLNTDNYYGIDISHGAIEHCMFLGSSEGWLTEKNPTFIVGDGTVNAVKDIQFDIVWAHSVFTHLPPDIIRNTLKTFSEMEFDAFYFTYKKRDKAWRSGLKQFGYPPQWFVEAAADVGLKATELDNKWPQGQHTMMIQ